MPVIEKPKRATIVFGDDGASIVSAYRRVEERLVEGDVSALLGERDIDLKPDEVKALFGASIDAHVTETNARADLAEAKVAALIVERDDLQAQVAAAGVEIAARGGQIGSLRDEISRLQADLSAAQAELAAQSADAVPN